MKRYIFIIIILIILMFLLLFNTITDKKQLDYTVEQYKNIQQEKTSLIKEIKEKDEEITALKVTIESIGIDVPNNRDTRNEGSK